MQLVPVEPSERDALLRVALAYWQELMPKAAVLDDTASYFSSRFNWQGDIKRPYWALLNSARIGFVSFTLKPPRATIHDFYILPEHRRRGYGTQLLNRTLTRFDAHQIERIDLNVRCDNPSALAFWQSNGFGIALYRLRQYRNPATGEAYDGTLSSDF
jgi:ribosomal protein S18 acetylase RimI-like enzyme